MLSLQTRERHHIILVQDMGYWWGIIQDKRPVLSRNMVLPVLYPNHANGEELGLSTQYMVEALMQMDPAVQEQLVHIFSQDRSLKNGFVYIGEEMGLVGGCQKRNNETEIAKKRTEQRKRVEEMNRRKKAARDKIEQEKRIIEGKVSKAQRKERASKATIRSEVSKISSGAKGYTCLSAVLASLDNEKKDTLAYINELKSSRDSLTKNSTYSEHILPQDHALCDKAIKDMEQHNEYIEQERKSIIAIAEQRAEVDFQRTQGDWDTMAQSEITKVNNMLKSNWAPHVSDNPQAAIDRIQANIRECEDFKKGVESLPNIRKKVDEQLQREKARLADIIQKVKTLMENPQPQAEELPKKNEDDAELQELANATDSVEIKNLAISALERGKCNVLEFAIKTKGLSVQATDSAGDTLLHQAVINNQVDVVKLLLRCGADKNAVNKRIRNKAVTPLTLADGNQEIKKILEDWK
jgi:DNA repair exonuclease SbcCD ATPase subunit